ncbi:hypothetical protein [Empedobacter brevis]|uniref:hypothetical protein n=1 Tax=Empedobacter brevis TaxID=247 RepID=UPI0028ACBD8F|nr:hypothetical protein [Empedobacter brevis]
MRHGLITTGLNHTLHKFTTPIFDNGDDPPKKKENDSQLLVMLDAEGGMGLGYTGIAGGNDEKGWLYVSNEGARNGNYLTGGDSKVVTQKFNTKNELLKELSGRYESRLEYTMSYNDVQIALKASLSDAKKYYHVYLHNCGDVVYKGMRAAGFNAIDISVSPNKMFFQFRDNYGGKWVHPYNKKVADKLYNTK